LLYSHLKYVAVTDRKQLSL